MHRCNRRAGELGAFDTGMGTSNLDVFYVISRRHWGVGVDSAGLSALTKHTTKLRVNFFSEVEISEERSGARKKS
jgi:hypothetical protein